MKKYFVTCRQALESKLLLQVCMIALHRGSGDNIFKCYLCYYKDINKQNKKALSHRAFERLPLKEDDLHLELKQRES